MARNTQTGDVYERTLEPRLEALAAHGIKCRSQANVGEKPGGGVHRVDWELWLDADESVRGLVSCKTQTSAGTAEEKIAYEVIKLLYTMDTDPRYRHAWLVLGGDGFSHSIRAFLADVIEDYIPSMAGRVTICTTDQFISRGGLLTAHT